MSPEPVRIIACLVALLATMACSDSSPADTQPAPPTSASSRSSETRRSTTTEATTTTVAPSTSVTTPPTSVTPSTTTEAPSPTGYAFPVQPANVASYGSTHHDYPASDVFAPCGTSVVAPTTGMISELTREDVWDSSVNDGATRGGLSVTLVGDDGVRYYGSHLSAVDDLMAPGARVEVGQQMGQVGASGNAAGTGCHLHFGISPPCGVGDWQVRRGTVQPAPFLDAWRAGDTGTSPVAEVVAWRDSHPAECG